MILLIDTLRLTSKLWYSTFLIAARLIVVLFAAQVPYQTRFHLHALLFILHIVRMLVITNLLEVRLAMNPWLDRDQTRYEAAQLFVLQVQLATTLQILHS